MGSKSAGKADNIIAIGHNFQQGLLEHIECSGRLRDQIEGGGSAGVSKNNRNGSIGPQTAPENGMPESEAALPAQRPKTAGRDR
jgi:hypothetical protein